MEYSNKAVVGVDTAKQVFQLHWMEVRWIRSSVYRFSAWRFCSAFGSVTGSPRCSLVIA